MSLHTPLVLALLAAALLSACSFGTGTTTLDGSGTEAMETREVGDFRSVSFALPGTLYLEQTDRPSVRIEGDDNLVSRVTVRVRGGGLEIAPEQNTRFQPRAPLRVYVGAPAIEAIRNAGSGAVEAPNLRASALELTLAGSGGIRVPGLTAEVLEVQLAGSGGVELSGRVRRQTLHVAGSGGVEAAELESDSLDANMIGSGSATVRVRDRISANLVGSGSVRYLGDPQVASRTVGSGRVSRIDP